MLERVTVNQLLFLFLFLFFFFSFLNNLVQKLELGAEQGRHPRQNEKGNVVAQSRPTGPKQEDKCPQRGPYRGTRSLSRVRQEPMWRGDLSWSVRA